MTTETPESDAAPRPTPAAPRKGPGRPRNPTAPRGEQQAALAAAVAVAEVRLDAAALAFNGSGTVAAELELLLAEAGVASAWSAYCRAQSNHTHAIKYGEQVAKLSGRAGALRDRLAQDKLEALKARADREDALKKPRKSRGPR